jgi:hypothetical protein
MLLLERPRPLLKLIAVATSIPTVCTNTGRDRRVLSVADDRVEPCPVLASFDVRNTACFAIEIEVCPVFPDCLGKRIIRSALEPDRDQPRQ